MPDNPAEIPLRSAYEGGKPPETVAVWEEQIRTAGSVEVAQLQVAYLQLLQLRTIKRILLWTLVLLPLAAFVVLAVVSSFTDVP